MAHPAPNAGRSGCTLQVLVAKSRAPVGFPFPSFARLFFNKKDVFLFHKEAFIKYQSDDQPTIMKDDAYIEDRINGI
jgi:hypothetical protein